MASTESRNPQIPERVIEQGSQFWDIYFRGGFTVLERAAGGSYKGVYEHSIPGKLLPREQPFSAARNVLGDHDYAADVRFWPDICDDFARCLLEILVSPPMYEDTVRNRQQVETLIAAYGLEHSRSDDYSQLREDTIDAIRTREMPLQVALNYVRIHEPTEFDFGLYEDTSDTVHLATERNLFIKAFGLFVTTPAIQDILAAVVENPYVDEETAGLAIWALGRQNAKNSIPLLVGWLSNPQLSRYSVAIERALQHLCSGPRLIAINYEDAAVYWGKITGLMPTGDNEWVAQDAASVFWEKRLRCARQHAGEYPEETAALLEDEVSQVREAMHNQSVTA